MIQVAIAQRAPNPQQVGKEALVEGFHLALCVLAGIFLLALLLASTIPKVETESVTAEEARQLVADVSSKRL